MCSSIVSKVELDACLILLVRCSFLFQAEDGIRDRVRSRGLGDVYKRQAKYEAIRDIDEASAMAFRIRAELELVKLKGVVGSLSLIHI